MEKEKWRPVPFLPEYEASSFGRIRRVPFDGPMPHGGVRRYGGQAWPGVWSPKDRRFIFVFRGRTYKVARVVCETFNGPAPRGRPDVMHDDENSRNNRPENLKWGNQKLNLNYPGFKKSCSATKRGKNGTVLSNDEIARIKRMCMDGAVFAQVAREFGVSACHVSNVMAGRARSKVPPASKTDNI